VGLAVIRNQACLSSWIPSSGFPLISATLLRVTDKYYNWRKHNWTKHKGGSSVCFCTQHYCCRQLLQVCGSKTATKLLKERYLWNAGNNEADTITHEGGGTVCAGTTPGRCILLLSFSPISHLCLCLCLTLYLLLPVCLWQVIAIQASHKTHIVQRKTQMVDCGYDMHARCDMCIAVYLLY